MKVLVILILVFIVGFLVAWRLVWLAAWFDELVEEQYRKFLEEIKKKGGEKWNKKFGMRN